MATSEQEDGHIRALRMLETLAGLQQPAALPTIAEQAQLTKTKAYRILRSLQDHGFCNPQRKLPRIGERSPLTSGCSGRSILAFLPEEEAGEIIRAHAPQSVRNGLSAMLALIRTQSYALSFSDNHEHINGIAAPLLDPNDGTPLGSIAVAGLDQRVPEETLLRLVTPLHAACSQLAPRLATVLGPNSSVGLESLDVTIRQFLDNDESPG